MSRIDPDALAFGTIVRVLVRRLAELEMSRPDGDMLLTIPDEVGREIMRRPLPDTAAVDLLKLRAEAGAIAEAMLGGLDEER